MKYHVALVRIDDDIRRREGQSLQPRPPRGVCSMLAPCTVQYAAFGIDPQTCEATPCTHVPCGRIFRSKSRCPADMCVEEAQRDDLRHIASELTV